MEPINELEKAIESKFLTPQKFAMEIEKIVVEEEFNLSTQATEDGTSQGSWGVIED